MGRVGGNDRILVAENARHFYDLRMSPELFVHLLPALFEPENLRGGVAVVIDVLRASTTIIHALAAGATAVIPCGEVAAARKLATTCPAGTALLGGERGGVRIPGFDLGNSPAECTAETVRGKTLIFTTTNGTQALLRCRDARRVFIAGFANLRAVTEKLRQGDAPIHLVCAGTDGRITLEDCLCAGALAAELLKQTDLRQPLDDSTTLVLKLHESTAGNQDAMLELMRTSRGGVNLINLGMATDIDIAARRDTFDFVPELSREPWRIGKSQE